MMARSNAGTKVSGVSFLASDRESANPIMSDQSVFSRRRLLRGMAETGVAGSLAASLASRAVRAGEPRPGGPPQPAQALSIQPYDPAVKRRIVFIHWRHVNPGWFRWEDEQGGAHGVGESFDPGTLRFRPTDSPQGIRLVAQPAERRGPLVHVERPWEKMGIWLVTVLHEKGVYRSWASCLPSLGETVFSYFESKDGMSWERPKLGLVERDGNRDNNILPLHFRGNCQRFSSIRRGAKRNDTRW